MKKIISLLSVFAMIATLFTTVAFADDNNKFYIEESVDGTNVTLTFYLTTDKTLGSASGTLDMTAAIAACDAISASASSGYIFNFNATQKVLSWTASDVNGFTGTQELGVLTLTNVKEDISFPQKRAFTAKDTAKVNVVADFTNEQVGYTVKAPVVGPELVENPYVFSFDADEETEVKITNSRTGDRTYSLPSFVKGASKVNALLKIKDSSSVQTGDKFTIDAIKGGKATTITTIEVK